MWPFSDSVPALPQVDPNFTDHIYATKHGVELLLRVWKADSTR